MTPEQNDLLCRVEGAAPMGRLMRQHWLPACMSEEVAEPDGTPLRVRLLGENLVVFRDSNGAIGVLDELCPHRRASLAYGRNEHCGLRCLYHGWKFDVTGKVVDMASEPDGTRLGQTVRAKSYPAHEAGGFVWVWMGDPQAIDQFEDPLWAHQAGGRIAIVKIHGACNWAQILEGAIDSAHSSSLHSTNMPTARDVAGSTATETAWLRPSADTSPRLEVEKLDHGFRYVAIRTPLIDPDRQDYVRMTVFVAPFTVHIPPNDRYRLSQMLVPVDDVNTMFYWIAWHPDPTAGISTEEWREFCEAVPGKDLEPVTFRKLRNAENGYLQDRVAMKAGDFTGIRGIPFQDMAMWESMGPIANRSEDRLGASDKAIVTFRTQMFRAAEAIARGEPAIGAARLSRGSASVTAFEGMVPKDRDWREISHGVMPADNCRCEADAPATD